MKSFFFPLLLSLTFLSCFSVVSSSVESSSTPMLRTALDILSKASTSSEVLSLNLSSLLILLVLKAVVIAVGFLSGGGGSALSARSISSSIQEDDITGGLCFISYISTSSEEKLSCIARTSCESPSRAREYLTAAKLWYKLHDVLKVDPVRKEYKDVVEVVKQAVVLSEEGGDCSVFQW